MILKKYLKVSLLSYTLLVSKDINTSMISKDINSPISMLEYRPGMPRDYRFVQCVWHDKPKVLSIDLTCFDRKFAYVPEEK